MARKRFITSNMSIDEKIASIATENPVAALMWPWFITGFDDWGRMEAAPMRIKLSIFPAFPYTAKDIEQAIELYAAYELVYKYEVNGKQYMAINPKKFYKYQTYIRGNKRESDASNCPPPPNPPWGNEEEKQFTDDSADALVKDNQRTDTRNCTQSSADERKCIPSPSPSDIYKQQQEDIYSGGGCENFPDELYDEDLKRIAKTYAENGFGLLPPAQVETVLDYAKEYSTEWVIMAIKRASLMGRRNLAYVHGILKRWKEDGQPDLGDNASKTRKRDSPKYKKFDFSV